MTIGLIVPVMVNYQGFTELMHTVDVPVHPIVIPNWQHNIGVSKGWNQGLRRAIELGLEYVFIVNDDVTFSPGAMQKMLDGLNEGYDLISAFGGDSDEPGVHEIVDEGSPDFAAFVVNPRAFVEKFGFFDENFTPAYFEDNDMRYRIQVGGGRQGIVLNAKMYHGGSVTQHWNGGQVVTSPMFESNRDYYRAKWGGTPGEEKYTAPFNGLTGKTFRDWKPLD